MPRRWRWFVVERSEYRLEPRIMRRLMPVTRRGAGTPADSGGILVCGHKINGVYVSSTTMLYPSQPWWDRSSINVFSVSYVAATMTWTITPLV